MTPFLYQVASLFYDKYKSEISTFAFVFPNRRSGLFFQKYLGEIAEKPIFSPTILSISDLFFQLSDKQNADKLNMLFVLYDIYKENSGSNESFDEFLYWGEMLLNDFDDVDKYMANARMLFTNISDLKEIERDFYFLSEEQIAAIRSFWSAFYPKTDSINQEQFLEVWKILYSLYDELRNFLDREGKGYEGMIFREVVENLERGKELNLPYKKIVFVGLNALSTVEERFLKQLQSRDIADFYWDYSSEMIKDPFNKASYFPLRNIKLFPSRYELKEDKELAQLDLFLDNKSNNQDIEVIGIPSGIGQAKQVYSLLKSLNEKGELNEQNALKTAIVLPDENLLIPVLNAIPEEIKRINVTMGYPLGGTPVASLMEYLLTLQQNIKIIDGKYSFYYRDVLPILNHRYVAQIDPEAVGELVSDITNNNRIYVAIEDLAKTPLLKVLFSTISDVASFSDYLIGILEQLNSMMNKFSSEDEENLQRANDLEQEFIFHYFTTLNRLKELMEERHIDMKLETYFRLLRRLTETITIPFQGEPLSGLQIMGVLETRALDFDRLIILSMNEGVFPLKKATNTFIPYNLRKGFGLPTYEHQDSIWAYHFYRLIYRAQSVSLLYDTRATGLLSGEVSRFVHQLNYHYEKPLKQKLTVYDVSSFKTPNLEMKKTDEIISKLSQFKKGGVRSLSASAINSYISCPLKFFFSTVEGIREADEVSESVENNVFGDIIHAVLEELYKPLCGKLVTADLLNIIIKDKAKITHAIEKAFAEKFFKSEKVYPLNGENFLKGEIIRKYVLKILEVDNKTLTPFHYIASEKSVNRMISITDGSEIRLKGFIDRIDDVRDKVRIVDYKSGTGDTNFTTIEDLFNSEIKKRNEKVMQVFFYCWMYDSVIDNRDITPCIYFARNLFKQFDPYIYQKTGYREKTKIASFSPLYEDFEKALIECLDNIFNEKIPFYQTDNEDICRVCLFKVVCGR